ncbi:hypothetical protein EON66_09235, partial [archaeon]
MRFECMHMRVCACSSSSPEQRELALEALVEFCREPALLMDLYVNFDCDVACINLFETLCRYVLRALPASVYACAQHVPAQCFKQVDARHVTVKVDVQVHEQCG